MFKRALGYGLIVLAGVAIERFALQPRAVMRTLRAWGTANKDTMTDEQKNAYREAMSRASKGRSFHKEFARASSK